MAKGSNGAAEAVADEEVAPSWEESAAAAYDAVEARENEAQAAEEPEEIAEEEEAAPAPKAGKRGRDPETGKFTSAGNDKAAVEVRQTPDNASEQADEAETPIVAPASMSAADRTAFAKLPPEMQAFVARRESEVTAGLTQKTQALAERSRRYDALDQVLGPRRQQFALMGASEAQVIGQLLALSDFATQDIGGFIKYMAQQRGVDLRTLIDNPDQPAPQVDPNFVALQQRFQSLENSLRQMTAGQEQALQQQVNSEIDAFRTQKSANGQPLHPHFDAVKVAMGALMQSGQAEDLQSAYDMAVRANPTTFAQLQAEQRAAAQRKRDADAKAAAAKAKQAQGTVLAPKGTTPGKPPKQTMEQTARDVAERLYSGAT